MIVFRFSPFGQRAVNVEVPLFPPVAAAVREVIGWQTGVQQRAHERPGVDHYRLTGHKGLFVVRDMALDVPAATRPEPLPVIPQQHLAQRVVGALRPSPAHQASPTACSPRRAAALRA